MFQRCLVWGSDSPDFEFWLFHQERAALMALSFELCSLLQINTVSIARNEACGINSMDNKRKEVTSETGEETKSFLDLLTTETKQVDQERSLKA